MNHSYVLAGNVYLGLLDTQGQLRGYFPQVLNVSELTLTKSDDNVLTQQSFNRNTYGQILNEVRIPGSWSLTLTNNQLFQEYMQMILLGDLTQLNTPETVVVDEPSTAYLDHWVPFANRGSVTAINITSNDGATNYIPGTDFEIDGRNALYRPLSTGNITPDQPLLVDYTLAAKSGFRVEGAKRTSFDVSLLLDGHNLANDHRVLMLAHHIKLTPQGGFDMMEQAIKAAQVGGNMITPPGMSNPFIYEDLGLDPDA